MVASVPGEILDPTKNPRDAWMLFQMRGQAPCPSWNWRHDSNAGGARPAASVQNHQQRNHQPVGVACPFQAGQRQGHQESGRGGSARARLPLTLDSAPIRCAIITPCFAVGGTETWINSLTASTHPDIQWAEVCVLDKSIAYGDTRYLLRNGVDVTFGVERARSLSKTHDVIVIWGTLSHPFWTSQSRARLVSVAHGDGSSTFTRSIMQGNAAADLHVACSAAAEPCLPVGRNRVTICNAIDQERLRPRAEPGSVRRSLGLGPDSSPSPLHRQAASFRPRWPLRF